MVNKFLYIKGGSETYMFGLANYLKKMGHEIMFFGMFDKKNMVSGNEKNFTQNMDLRTKSFKRYLYPFKVIYSSEAKEKIGIILEQFKPDIVHLNNYNYQLTPSIIYEIKKYKIPIVQTLHDYNLITPNHILYNYEKGEICEKCKGNRYYNCVLSKCIHDSYIKSFIGATEAYLYYILKTYNKIEYFICPSNFIAKKVIEFGISKNKIRVIPNFIEKISNISTDKADYILYFGRISQEKGIETLLKAIESLPNIKFVFAGKGPLEHKLQNYNNIEYVGFKQKTELDKLIAESLFTLCPSECYENSPMSVLESQAMFTPVIGSEIGGIPELIDDGVDGLLFKPGDAKDLESKIQLLYNNKELLKQYSIRCNEKIKRFSVDNYYNKLLEVYKEAINNN